jgi:hypothetical protein
MDPIGIRLTVDPAEALLFCGFLAGGVALGTVSGLTPGIHANTFALVLAGLAPLGDCVSPSFQHMRIRRRVTDVSRYSLTIPTSKKMRDCFDHFRR